MKTGTEVESVRVMTHKYSTSFVPFVHLSTNLQCVDIRDRQVITWECKAKLKKYALKLWSFFLSIMITFYTPE